MILKKISIEKQREIYNDKIISITRLIRISGLNAQQINSLVEKKILVKKETIISFELNLINDIFFKTINFLSNSKATEQCTLHEFTRVFKRLLIFELYNVII